jgi:hypothetical protein
VYPSSTEIPPVQSKYISICKYYNNVLISATKGMWEIISSKRGYICPRRNYIGSAQEQAPWEASLQTSRGRRWWSLPAMMAADGYGRLGGVVKCSSPCIYCARSRRPTENWNGDFSRKLITQGRNRRINPIRSHDSACPRSTRRRWIRWCIYSIA